MFHPGVLTDLERRKQELIAASDARREQFSAKWRQVERAVAWGEAGARSLSPAKPALLVGAILSALWLARKKNRDELAAATSCWMSRGRMLLDLWLAWRAAK